jgi:hypothetical protein
MIAAQRYDEDVKARRFGKGLKSGSILQREKIETRATVVVEEEMLRLEGPISGAPRLKTAADEVDEVRARQDDILAHVVCEDVGISVELTESKR